MYFAHHHWYQVTLQVHMFLLDSFQEICIKCLIASKLSPRASRSRSEPPVAKQASYQSLWSGTQPCCLGILQSDTRMVCHHPSIRFVRFQVAAPRLVRQEYCFQQRMQPRREEFYGSYQVLPHRSLLSMALCLSQLPTISYREISRQGNKDTGDQEACPREDASDKCNK